MRELIKDTQVCVEAKYSAMNVQWSMEIAGKKYGSCLLVDSNKFANAGKMLERVIRAVLMQVEGIINGVMALRAGKWEMKQVEKNGIAEMKAVCSLCGVPNKQYTPPYCPHCGAKMEVGE